MTETVNTHHLICDDVLRQQVRDRLGSFTLHPHKKQAGTQAAVAITIVDEGLGANINGLPSHPKYSKMAAMVLTRRSAGLKNHAGQWAFPGGRMETGESPEDAALRELAEEVHLNLDPDSILGRLDDFTTRSGFVITPVVVWGGTDVQLTPNPGEVQSIHRIPVSEFLRRDAPILENSADGKNPILLMPVGNNWIAAPTAAMIYQFREVAIFGRATRVAHFEQPAFAWK